MIKPNLHFLRKKHEINVKRIKNLLVLEEQYVYGNISKKMIEDMTKLYQGFISYCEEIKEPMKLYFQEKLEYLYYNEKVFQAVIADQDNEEDIEEVHLLNNDFLNFSEIAQVENQPKQNDFSNYESNQAEGKIKEIIIVDFKLKKEHQNKMMMKVNEELKKRKKEKKKVLLTSPRK